MTSNVSTDSVADKIYKSLLLRDLAVAAAFVVLGIVAQNSSDVMLAHISGISFGAGFGFALRSIMVAKAVR